MRQLGPTAKKILLLLEGGIVLSLAHRPDTYFRILKKISKEWGEINELNLRRTIKRLYNSKLIDYRENNDDSVSIILTDNGKKRVLRFNLDKISIKKPLRWDKLWRLVIFDIPEKKNQGRKALVAKLKELNFYPMQKSVFIHPYECKNEIDFITEIFELYPYVRFFRVKDADIDLDLRNRFQLS